MGFPIRYPQTCLEHPQTKRRFSSLKNSLELLLGDFRGSRVRGHQAVTAHNHSFSVDHKNLPVGFTRRYFHPWKPQSLGPASENWFERKAEKSVQKSSHVFVEESRFTTVLEASVGQLHFLPSHVHLLLPWQSLSAHSLCCALGATAAHTPSNLGWSSWSYLSF